MVPVPLWAGAGPLLATLLILGAVSADNDCLWYTDKQGNWHNGFDCPFFKFCCGNCTYRYCCVDPMQLISEKQQKYCMSVNLSSTTVAGIASAILLFIVIVGILVCCFLCSCCYLYRRRHQMRLPFTGGREVIRSFPMQPTNPPSMPPGAYPPYPTAPGYGVAGPREMTHNYPLQPAYPANMPPAPYAPYPSAPSYNAATAPPYASS
ncbi:protein shisa-4 [Carcharodon carcharias]|uniref:protein shisa-4 n=1 Tax=Carcharodon carcharias TaxID=13397 RepID=UPI001B7DBA56|nr:protein shisa-4 [Carcharodon carcharias]